ncbi:phosphopantetheine-binding protein [Streptomyces sp900105755]|uniref:phosphopantetheine-binding protein n=1 Tax=Streptomyces sp. 900105755 TaxID=3154389 RepID=UPI00331BA1D0
MSPRTGSDTEHALARILPRHLVPAVVVAHNFFPLNAQGKVDLPALAAATRPKPSGPSGRRLNAREEMIVSLVAGVCGVHPGLDENFFDAGMHSLQALRLALRTTAATGRDVGLPLVLAHPTVRSLAAAVTSAPPAASGIHRLPRS